MTLTWPTKPVWRVLLELVATMGWLFGGLHAPHAHLFPLPDAIYFVFAGITLERFWCAITEWTEA